MNLEDALQTPIEFNGLKFARLDMDDLAAWCASIKANRKAKGEAKLKANKTLATTPGEQERELRALEAEEVALGEVIAQAYTPAGIAKILRDSLVKSGQCKTVDEAESVIKRKVHFTDQRRLAIDVLSPPALENDRPLAESDTAATGQPISPSSESIAE